MPKEHIPTFNQMQTMRWLLEGRELLTGVWPDHVDKKYAGKERMWWRWREPKFDSHTAGLFFEGFDTMGVGGPPKMYRYKLSHMERYGWLVKTATSWAVTEGGKEALGRYDAWWAAVNRRLV
jgi:hypothetical protein